MNMSPDLHDSPTYSARRCIALLCGHHGLDLTAEASRLVGEDRTAGGILRAAQAAGLKARTLTGQGWDDLRRIRQALPAIAVLKNGNAVLLVNVEAGAAGSGAESGQVAVLDPLTEQVGIILLDQPTFLDAWAGTVILAKRAYSLTDPAQPFGLGWFVPQFLGQWRCFRDASVAAVMIQLLALSSPLLFQIIIDKVISHRSYQTLAVVIAVFMVITVFEAVFSYIRQYLLLFATNKIDAKLASRTFAHLLSLPMDFFEANTAGALAKHMQQTEKIRQFLTGRLLGTLLDATSLVIVLPLLLFYSVKLTMVVLLFSGIIAAIIGVMVPAFRRRLKHLYAAEGARQTHLVEAIHGMRTVKSLALEPTLKRLWDGKVAETVRTHFRVGRMAAGANVLTHAAEKLMMIAVIGIGALDVFDGVMTIGALVAFQMLAGRVSNPLVQIVGLVNEYQETALSVSMLAEVMNRPPERDPAARGVRPAIRGRLEVEAVTFHYPGSVTRALDNVSFSVGEGQVIGVVGRSGSGKTTLTRLIQGIHSAPEGLIRLDGTDVRQIDLPHLRRGIGVVLQDTFLFRGTIRDNIAVAKPEAGLDEIVEVARLAGADEFIDRLPQAYDTVIEEGAANLSGGQKQRLGIARALLLRPSLLIFDEATSALDPESEGIIQRNLAAIARGRTMIIVSHRLSSLIRSDAILVLDRGRVADFAPHQTLVERCAIYANLWHQQTEHLR